MAEWAKAEGSQTVVLSGVIEGELNSLDQADRQQMLGELGLEETGLERLIRAGYHLLGYQTFSAGEKEVRRGRSVRVIRRSKLLA